jgi:hypothetical protein
VLRAEFAGSRWLDLRTAGTAYIGLAIALGTARGTDGYQTVWFYQRLSATCAEHGQPLNGSTSQPLRAPLMIRILRALAQRPPVAPHPVHSGSCLLTRQR